MKSEFLNGLKQWQSDLFNSSHLGKFLKSKKALKYYSKDHLNSWINQLTGEEKEPLLDIFRNQLQQKLDEPEWKIIKNIPCLIVLDENYNIFSSTIFQNDFLSMDYEIYMDLFLFSCLVVGCETGLIENNPQIFLQFKDGLRYHAARIAYQLPWGPVGMKVVLDKLKDNVFGYMSTVFHSLLIFFILLHEFAHRLIQGNHISSPEQYYPEQLSFDFFPDENVDKEEHFADSWAFSKIIKGEEEISCIAFSVVCIFLFWESISQCAKKRGLKYVKFENSIVRLKVLKNLYPKIISEELFSLARSFFEFMDFPSINKVKNERKRSISLIGDHIKLKTKPTFSTVFSDIPLSYQDVIICLAPFKGVIDIELLEVYFMMLKDIPDLKDMNIIPINNVVNLFLRQKYFKIGKISNYIYPQPSYLYKINWIKQTSEYICKKDLIEGVFYQFYLFTAEARWKEGGELSSKVIFMFVSEHLDNIIEAIKIGLYHNYSSCIMLCHLINDIIGSNVEIDQIIYSNRKKILSFDYYIEQLGLVAFVLHEVGNNFLLAKEYSKARHLYRSSLGICNLIFKIDHVSANAMKCINLHNLGILEGDINKINKAKSYFKKELKIELRQHNLKNAAKIYREMAHLATKANDYNDAFSLYERSSACCKYNNDKEMAAWNQISIASLHVKLNMYEKALILLEKSLNTFLKITNNEGCVECYKHMSQIALEKSDWLFAEDICLKGLKITEMIEDHHSTAYFLFKLGSIFKHQSNWIIASEHFLKALSVCIEIRDDDNVASTLYELASLWKKTSSNNLIREVSKLLGISFLHAKLSFMKMIENES